MDDEATAIIALVAAGIGAILVVALVLTLLLWAGPSALAIAAVVHTVLDDRTRGLCNDVWGRLLIEAHEAWLLLAVPVVLHVIQAVIMTDLSTSAGGPLSPHPDAIVTGLLVGGGISASAVAARLVAARLASHRLAQEGILARLRFIEAAKAELSSLAQEQARVRALHNQAQRETTRLRSEAHTATGERAEIVASRLAVVEREAGHLGRTAAVLDGRIADLNADVARARSGSGAWTDVAALADAERERIDLAARSERWTREAAEAAAYASMATPTDEMTEFDARLGAAVEESHADAAPEEIRSETVRYRL